MRFSKTDLARKLLIVSVGSIFSAYGITLAIGAGYGGATLAVLWQGVSRTFGISLGWASFAVAIIMILFALVYDIRQIQAGTVIYQILYSYFLDVFAALQRYTHWSAVNFLIMLTGVAVFAVGTGIYASADFGRGSYEAVTFALVDKNHWQVKYVRMSLDAAVVAAGVSLGGKFGACTVCTVLMSGPIIQSTVKQMKKLLFTA